MTTVRWLAVLALVRPSVSDAKTSLLEAFSGILVQPARAVVSSSRTTTLSATVTGSAVDVMTWTVSESGQNRSSGLYTAPGPAGIFTSVANPSSSGSATETRIAAPPLGRVGAPCCSRCWARPASWLGFRAAKRGRPPRRLSTSATSTSLVPSRARVRSAPTMNGGGAGGRTSLSRPARPFLPATS